MSPYQRTLLRLRAILGRCSSPCSNTAPLFEVRAAWCVSLRRRRTTRDAKPRSTLHSPQSPPGRGQAAPHRPDSCTRRPSRKGSLAAAWPRGTTAASAAGSSSAFPATSREVAAEGFGELRRGSRHPTLVKAQHSRAEDKRGEGRSAAALAPPAARAGATARAPRALAAAGAARPARRGQQRHHGEIR